MSITWGDIKQVRVDLFEYPMANYMHSVSSITTSLSRLYYRMSVVELVKSSLLKDRFVQDISY